MTIVITTTYKIPAEEIVRQNETYEDLVNRLMNNPQDICDYVHNKKETIKLIIKNKESKIFKKNT